METVENLLTHQIIILANNALSDIELFNYVYRTIGVDKELGTDKNDKMMLKFINADPFDFKKLQQLFDKTYNDNIILYLPVIINMIDENVKKILDIFANNPNVYKKEYFMIELMTCGSYMNDVCSICLREPSERSRESQIVFECKHIICHDCWIKYNYNKVCPLCRKENTSIITPFGLKLCNYPEFENTLRKIAPLFISILEKIHPSH